MASIHFAMVCLNFVLKIPFKNKGLKTLLTGRTIKHEKTPLGSGAFFFIPSLFF